jgi:hypothetical protein
MVDLRKEIFGEQWRTILDIWLQTTEVANKLDWIMPIDMKSDMMKICQKVWQVLVKLLGKG